MKLSTTNINCNIAVFVQPFLDKLIARTEVEGIALLGGLGKRDFSDEYSDIDISVLLRKNNSNLFSLPFEFHQENENFIAEFNIHAILYEDEIQSNWNHGKIEAYKNARIVYDKHGLLKDLLDKKVVFDEEEAFNRLIWLIQQYKWRVQIHSIRTYKRGYPEGAHYLINEGVKMLIECIYLLNKEYMPHTKWIYPKLKELNNFGLYDDIVNALYLKDFSWDNLITRIKNLDMIYSKILRVIQKQIPKFPSNPYQYYYKHNVQIKSETKIDELCNSSDIFAALSHKEQERIYNYLCFNLIDDQSSFNDFINCYVSKKTPKIESGLRKKH